MITDEGCWADYRTAAASCVGRPCLFLDRDGVLIEDTGYPHRPKDVMLIPEALALVLAANERGVVVGIVTNQSGIGRGLFDWAAFSSVQAMIDEAVRPLGGHIDFVLACPFHAEASVLRYRCETHGWRKPAPGMMRAAADTLGLVLAQSCMLGDRMSDMEAAAAAGIPHRLLLKSPEMVFRHETQCTTVPRDHLTHVFRRTVLRLKGDAFHTLSGRGQTSTGIARRGAPRPVPR